MAFFNPRPKGRTATVVPVLRYTEHILRSNHIIA
nr:MAG TPA: hypothetical protein [Caudoviricetes sp.]